MAEDRRQGRTRLHPALLLIPLALLVWGMSGWLFVALSGHAGAAADYQFRHMTMRLVVPSEGKWWDVDISMYIYDDQTSDFGEAFAEAREDIMQRFPGAIERTHSDVQGAYVLAGWKWPAGAMSWAYNPAGKPASLTGDHQAIQSGAAAWGTAGAAFQFTGGGTTTAGTGACQPSGLGRDGQNTVGWQQQSSSVLAIACTWYSGGVASETDIEFSPSWNWTTGPAISIDLQSVATHEFGHAAGLGHSADPTAVMFASYSNGSNKRELRQDDINGLIAIYGQVSGPDTPTPTDTSTATNTPVQAATNTPLPTATNTPPPTPTNTPTTLPTPTNTPVQNTPTNTPSPVATPTNTPGASAQASPPVSTPTPPGTPLPASTPPSGGNTPTPSPTLPPGAVNLVPGANLISWTVGSSSPADALNDYQGVVSVVYGWDPANQRWQRYAPGVPGYVNNLLALEPGRAYWMIASISASITFHP